MSFLGKLFESKEKKLQRQQADAEKAATFETLSLVHNRNNSHFYRQHAGGLNLALDMVLAKPTRDVSGLFLLGVAMEIIEKSPPLPTPPYLRAYIHLLFFFVKTGSTLEEAQSRVHYVQEQFESLDKVAAYIVSQGREAVHDDDPTFLTRCYEATNRHNLLSGSF